MKNNQKIPNADFPNENAICQVRCSENMTCMSHVTMTSNTVMTFDCNNDTAYITIQFEKNSRSERIVIFFFSLICHHMCE